MIEQKSVLLEVIAITEDDTYPYTLLQPVSKYYDVFVSLSGIILVKVF